MPRAVSACTLKRRAGTSTTPKRPADANEAAEAWRVALQTTERPTSLVLSRQALPTLDRSRCASAAGVARGAYVLVDAASGAPDVLLIGSGSEEDGFVKIHVREGTDRILGATIVGRYAGEMINTISLARVAGIGLRQLAHVVHAYPTQGDAIRQAAQACASAPAPPWRAWLQRQGLQR